MFIGIPWYRCCIFFNTTTGTTTRMCRKAELTPCQRLYGARLRASNRTVEVLYFDCLYVWEWHFYTRVTKNLLHLVDSDYANVLQQCVPSLLKVQRRHPLTIPKEFSSAVLRVIQFVNPIRAWHAHTTSHPTRFRLSIMPSSNSCCLSGGRSKSHSFLILTMKLIEFRSFFRVKKKYCIWRRKGRKAWYIPCWAVFRTSQTTCLIKTRVFYPHWTKMLQMT